MSLAFLTLSLLCAAPAQAQGGYPGGGSGSGYPGAAGWVAQPSVVNGVSHPAVVTGTISGSTTDAHGNVTPITGDWHNDGSSPPPLSVNAGEAVTYKVNGTVTYTWVWNGGPSNILPPSTQQVREQATASAAGGGDVLGTITATASDGFGDETSQHSISPDGKTQNVSDGGGGSHLITMDGSSGTLTVVGNLSAELDLSEPASSGYPGGGYPGGGYPGGGYPGSGGSGTLSGTAGCYFTAALEMRKVTISASVDSTFYKIADPNTPTDANGDANYIPGLHFPDHDGTMRGDVGLPIAPNGVGPTPLTNITYQAYVEGNWQTSGSSYNWFSSLKQQGDNGSLYPPDFTNQYLDPWWVDSQTPGVPPLLAPNDGDPTKPDHINIKCIDGGDGFVATGNYYMTLHPTMEKNYPDHKNSDFVNPRQVSVNLISSGPTDVLGGGISVQIDYALSASAAGPAADLIAGILGINVTFTVEKDFQTVSNVASTGLPAGWYTYVMEYDHYYDHYGKADNWDMTGYAGTSPYTIREVPSNEADRFGLKMAPMQPVGGSNPGH